MNPILKAEKHKRFKAYLENVLEAHGTISSIARGTGVSRQAVHQMFVRYGMVEFAKTFKAKAKKIEEVC